MNSTLSSTSPALIEQVHTLMHMGRSELDKENLDLGLQYFGQALSLLPNDPGLHLDQGMSLSRFGKSHDRKDILLLASKKFKTAISYSKDDLWTLWYSWGSTLSHLGFLSSEFHYFLEAEEKLKKALTLCSEASAIDRSEISAEYAVVRRMLAAHSKEAYDWRVAIQAFETALSISPAMNYEFWNHFGTSYMELSKLLLDSDVKLYVQAIHCFKSAIADAPKHLPSWKNLCDAMQALYSHTQDEDHFSQTNQCFEMCFKLSSSYTIYRDWAVFLLQSAIMVSDGKKLSLSLEKCEKAHEMGLTEDPILLATWGEGLSLLGVETDKVQLIQEGQEKIEEALTIDSSNPLFWKAFGESFHALGLYFEELDYHYLAVEKLQEGLSLDRTQDTLWQSLAHIYMHIGVATEDLEELKKSLYFHQKAIDLKSNESSYLYSKACCLSRMGELSRQESYLSEALAYFEKALQMKKHTLHLHPDWLFEYAKCLDLFADFFEEEHFYHKAIELFLHVLVAEPDYPKIYHRLGLAYSHLAELSHEVQNFHRAVYFFKLALKRNHEDDQVLVDFAISLINLADHSHETSEIEAYFEEAKRKLFLAAQAGNGQAYYQLACLFSLNHDIEKSIFFLRKAENCLTLPSVGELLEDDWLDHVRSSPDFSQFLQELEKKINLKEDS